jgi:heavy metal translocating P-type ATPase
MTDTECTATAAPPTGLFGEADLSQERLFRRNRIFLGTTFACMAFGAMIALADPGQPWERVGTVVSLVGLVLGFPLFWIAAKTIFSRRPRLTTEVFITIALVAVVYEGELWYASWIVFIMWLGETLMAWAGRHARSAVEGLLRLVPRQARLVTDDGLRTVPVETIEVGQRVMVHPGERIPVDGVVYKGQTAVDESMLTGEAIPVDRGPGEEVFAGTYNLQGAIGVQVSRAIGQNAVSRIVELMRKAQREHVPAQRTVDLFLRWFLPLVLLIAAAVGIATGSLERVATILLVITPCAFAASTPLAVIATVGNAAKRGIVIKGGSGLEAASRATVVLLDKTGTLTASTPRLGTVDAITDLTEDEVLRLAAAAEKPSSHPLARAVVMGAAEREITAPDPEEFEVASGHGVIAELDGHRLAVGNARFLDQRGIELPERGREVAALREEAGNTVAYVVRDGVVVGVLGFLAPPRSDAAQVIAGLRRLGVRKLVMVTGDRSRPAEAVARQLGIEYRAQATPEAKLAEVQRYQREGHVVAMVGDGINDSTALAAADVGIAMVSAGAEVAALAADVVVHGDHLDRVLVTARLARRGIRTIQLNIMFATVYNLVGLGLALSGVISPGAAALFHAASFISVVVNSSLVLGYDPKVSMSSSEQARRQVPADAAAAP